MEELIALFNLSEGFASGLLLVLIIGFGLFFAYRFWPWFTVRVDKTLDSWMELKRMELQAQAERDMKFSDAWQQHSKHLQAQKEILLQHGLMIQTLIEGQKSLIGTLLSFVDDRKLQDRLYEALEINLAHDTDKPNKPK